MNHIALAIPDRNKKNIDFIDKHVVLTIQKHNYYETNFKETA